MNLALLTEASTSLKRARKYAKTVLKSDSLNFEMWLHYAQLEMANGNETEALKVYCASLDLLRDQPSLRQLPVIATLFRAIADWLLWSKGHTRTVMHLISYFSDFNYEFDSTLITVADSDTPITPTAILTTQKVFTILLLRVHFLISVSCESC